MGDGLCVMLVVDEGMVYFFMGEGILGVLNVEMGIFVWSFNMVDSLGGKVVDYGMVSLFFVDDDWVIVIVGVFNVMVVCFFKVNGELKWKLGSDWIGYLLLLIM